MCRLRSLCVHKQKNRSPFIKMRVRCPIYLRPRLLGFGVFCPALARLWSASEASNYSDVSVSRVRTDNHADNPSCPIDAPSRAVASTIFCHSA
jgi:hypothetical protein